MCLLIEKSPLLRVHTFMQIFINDWNMKQRLRVSRRRRCRATTSDLKKARQVQSNEKVSRTIQEFCFICLRRSGKKDPNFRETTSVFWPWQLTYSYRFPFSTVFGETLYCCDTTIYSPDLAPGDFLFLPKLTRILKEQLFPTLNKIKAKI